MGSKISKPTKDLIAGLTYRESATLDKPLTLPEDISKNVQQVATNFFAKLYEVRHVSWDRGGAFFHELFDYYKRYPKLQVEFLTQTLMQLRKNPHRQYELKLHWVLMEFLFHGTNHLLINEILCEFYKQVLLDMNKQIKNIETCGNIEGLPQGNPVDASAAGGGGGGTGAAGKPKTEAELEVLYHPYRIKATAEYTNVNLQSIVDYGNQSGCSMGGTPKWLVVELHDTRGISYHRKVIRYKLYERKARYVDTVAQEFGFSDPQNSELFVVYTDARKTSYRVNYGHDMLRPDEELRYDLDWTDCYFIYKNQDIPLKDNLGNVVRVPDDNGQVFYLCSLPEDKAVSGSDKGSSSSRRSSSNKKRHSSVSSRHGASKISNKIKSTDAFGNSLDGGSSDTSSVDVTAPEASPPNKETTKHSVAETVSTQASSTTLPSPSVTSVSPTGATTSERIMNSIKNGSPQSDGGDDSDRRSVASADFATPTAGGAFEDDEETMILFRGNRVVK